MLGLLALCLAGVSCADSNDGKSDTEDVLTSESGGSTSSALSTGPVDEASRNPSDSESGDDLELGPCATLLECAQAANVVVTPLETVYGEDGTCWQEFERELCWQDCRAQKLALRPQSDGSIACQECIEDEDCALVDPTAPTCAEGNCVAEGPNCDTISFGLDVQQILDANCITCHAPGGAYESLDMTVNAYDDLVDGDGIQTMAISDVALVVPGNLESSYILHKLNGTQETIAGAAGGTQMPQGQQPLPVEQRDTIATWIECGAPP